MIPQPSNTIIVLTPNAAQLNTNPRYRRQLIERAGLTQEQAAARIGVTGRSMRNYLSEAAANPAPYMVQFALECLAECATPDGRADLDQFEAYRAFQKLGSKAQMDHWMRAQGHIRRVVDPLDAPSLAELAAIGRDWVSCAERLPHEDDRAHLNYMVCCPNADNWIRRCRYEDGRWRQYEDLYISGVTHWRLAQPDENDRRAKAAELPTG